MQQNEATKRITVRLPAWLLAQLRRQVPPRERSAFICAATAAELERKSQARVLRAAAGAWSTENHPDLLTQEDVNRYLGSVRSSLDRLTPE